MIISKIAIEVVTYLKYMQLQGHHMHMFHHPLHLNYDIEEKSEHYMEEQNYAVAHEAPPLTPLSR